MDEINISSDLERENERLREELAMMKNQMLRMRTKLKEQQNYISSSSSQQSQQQQLFAENSSKHQKASNAAAGVLLELPVTMRSSTTNTKQKQSPSSQMQKQQREQEQSSSSQGRLLGCISSSKTTTTAPNKILQVPHGNAREKDHSSVSTADDRPTLEAPMDLEAHHQSAAGLHHRHNIISSMASHETQTLKTGPTADDSLSSSDAAYDDDEMDGLVRVASTSSDAAAATLTNSNSATIPEQMTFCKS
ncbi:MAG: hypothetical protein SGILL_009781, partial [Bacillariaceae sp.]